MLKYIVYLLEYNRILQNARNIPQDYCLYINLQNLYTKLKKVRKLRWHDPETDVLRLSVANAR